MAIRMFTVLFFQLSCLKAFKTNISKQKVLALLPYCMTLSKMLHHTVRFLHCTRVAVKIKCTDRHVHKHVEITLEVQSVLWWVSVSEAGTTHCRDEKLLRAVQHQAWLPMCLGDSLPRPFPEALHVVKVPLLLWLFSLFSDLEADNEKW